MAQGGLHPAVRGHGEGGGLGRGPLQGLHGLQVPPMCILPLSLCSTFLLVQPDTSSSSSFTTSSGSPSNGAASDAAGFIADNPYSSLWGDTHYYNYRSTT